MDDAAELGRNPVRALTNAFYFSEILENKGPSKISEKFYVDEKVDNSGWRIKIVAECGYTHQIVGQKWVPRGALLSRGSLARRRARNIVQVHAHALNGSWECYHVVRIGLGAIWGDHGRRRSLHFTTPHLRLKKGCVYPLLSISL